MEVGHILSVMTTLTPGRRLARRCRSLRCGRGIPAPEHLSVEHAGKLHVNNVAGYGLSPYRWHPAGFTDLPTISYSFFNFHSSLQGYLLGPQP